MNPFLFTGNAGKKLLASLSSLNAQTSCFFKTLFNNIFSQKIWLLLCLLFLAGNVHAQVTATCRQACSGISPVSSCGDGYVFSYTHQEWQTDSYLEVRFNGTNIFNQNPSWTLVNCTSVTWEVPYLQISKQSGASPETWYILVNPTARTITASNQAPACGEEPGTPNPTTQTTWIYGDNTATLMPLTANAGIGNEPLSNAKLYLHTHTNSTDTVSGLHATMDHITTTNTSKPSYGAYLRNRRSSSSGNSGSDLYGVYLDNANNTYSGSAYGVYSNNTIDGYGKSAYGFYNNNIGGSGYARTLYGLYSANSVRQAEYTNTYGAYLKNAKGGGCINGTMYGIHITNVDSSVLGSVYGAYLDNTRQSTTIGDVYGIYSINNNNSVPGKTYGAYLSATRTSNNAGGQVYGIYSTVSGGQDNNRYAGYFDGGNIVVMNGKMGIGCDPGDAVFKIRDTAFPNFVLEGAATRLQIGVAMNNTNFAPYAQAGDIVYRPLGNQHGLIFHLPNDNSDGKSYIKFGDDTNGGWVSIFNNRTMIIDGNVGIGTTTPSYKLDVDGIIRAREVVINLNEGADFVFEENYALRPLDEVHNFIQTNKHLPEIPSAADMVNNGLDMGEFQIKLLQKIEELTLYVIDQDKRIKQQQEEINRLKIR